MKRMLILLAIVLFSVGTLFAEEAVLIDFASLAADIMPDEETNLNTQNRRTLMDYANVAGASFTDEQKTVMKTSLAIANWDVQFASSSRFVNNITRTYTAEAPSKQFGTVMGLRIHFPVEPYNSWAIVRPPFEIPAFEPQATIDDDGNIEPAEGNDGISGRSRFESDEASPTASSYGVVKNVGVIKSIAVNVYGLNFPHGLFTIYIDNQGISKEVFMGYLNYDGWGELRWDNPAYVQEVRNRNLRLYPLYPTSTPFVKFGGFRVARDAAQEGGDFIAYFKDVKIIYDKAVLDTERDIDDEALWRIIETRETARKVWEMERFGQNQVLRYLEREKQATESAFTPTETNEQQQ
ncbi:MAG TPA: flagellar protein [Treponema sp.]|nr:flagellar protein [Treponema sp.]